MSITIPQEVADGITVANLKDWRDYLQSELNAWYENPKTEDNPNGNWIHPEDIASNHNYIRACNLLIKAFGGSE